MGAICGMQCWRDHLLLLSLWWESSLVSPTRTSATAPPTSPSSMESSSLSEEYWLISSPQKPYSPMESSSALWSTWPSPCLRIVAGEASSCSGASTASVKVQEALPYQRWCWSIFRALLGLSIGHRCWMWVIRHIITLSDVFVCQANNVGYLISSYLLYFPASYYGWKVRLSSFFCLLSGLTSVW